MVKTDYKLNAEDELLPDGSKIFLMDKASGKLNWEQNLCFFYPISLFPLPPEYADKL